MQLVGFCSVLLVSIYILAAEREFEGTKSQGYEPRVFRQLSYFDGKVPAFQYTLRMFTVLSICENKLHSEQCHANGSSESDI